MPPDPTPTRRPRLLRCAICGRADEVPAADQLRFTRTGWPKCCGQVMALVTDDGPVARTPPPEPRS